eukprot:2086820-Prorocentrum_lima.AAC.1
MPWSSPILRMGIGPGLGFVGGGGGCIPNPTAPAEALWTTAAARHPGSPCPSRIQWSPYGWTPC